MVGTTKCLHIAHMPRPKFTDIVLRFILRCVIRSSEDKSYDVVRLSYDIF